MVRRQAERAAEAEKAAENTAVVEQKGGDGARSDARLKPRLFGFLPPPPPPVPQELLIASTTIAAGGVITNVGFGVGEADRRVGVRGIDAGSG